MENNYTDNNSSANNRIKNFFTIAISFLVGMTVALYFVPGRQSGLSKMQSNKLDEVGWTGDSNPTHTTHNVANKHPNELGIFDMTGKMLKQIPVDPSMQSVTVNGYELSAGIYLYSLVVNGQEIDTKRMILSK